MRPYLLVDVDFTLNPDFRATWDAPEGNALRQAGWVIIQGFTFNERSVWLNVWHGRDLLRVAYETGAELAWATNWGALANRVVSPILGLPHLPVAGTPGVSKAQAVPPWCAGRPFVWLDDDEGSDVMAACERTPGGAGVKVNPATGLTAANLHTARSLLAVAAGKELEAA